MVFYFTATGNSLYVAKQLDGERFSIAQEIHKADKSYNDDKIGIVCPIFGHEMPQLVKDFIKEAKFNTDYLYLVLTYGNRHGGAAEIAQNEAAKSGKRFDYISMIEMVDNFLVGFDMNEQKKLDKKVDAHIAEIKTDIDSKKQWIFEVTDADREAHNEFVKRMAAMPPDAFKKMYRITNECVGCCICSKVCPMDCFEIHNQHAEWNSEKCIACMACIHACPQMAIQMNMPEVNPKARYRNENIRITEIISANCQH